MKELWKDIEEFEGYYEVSNMGNVRSKDRYFHNWRAKCKLKGKPKKAWNHSRGYLMVDLYKDNKSHKRFVHRLVAIAFIPNPNGYPNVNHIDNNGKNNLVSNLEWCTQAMNVEHARSLGLLKKKGK